MIQRTEIRTPVVILEPLGEVIQKRDPMNKGFVYILFNRRNGTLYIGVSSDLVRRIHEHKTKTHVECFTAKYDVTKLGYFEAFDDMEHAILREKQIKAGSRKKKLALIEMSNPEWRDLYEGIVLDWITCAKLVMTPPSSLRTEGEAIQSNNCAILDHFAFARDDGCYFRRHREA